MGGRAKAEASAIHLPTRSHVQGMLGGVLRRGGSLVGADDSLLPCGGVTRCHSDENFIMVVGAKWLGRLIFVVKPTLGVDFGNVVAPMAHANVPLRH